VNVQLEHGVEGLIVGGTTGEGQLMTWDEHIMLIAHTVNCFGDRLKVRLMMLSLSVCLLVCGHLV
jgi:4-hydroxy-tetrahydrodipicolinate synthase